jgi:hypothetical protein
MISGRRFAGLASAAAVLALLLTPARAERDTANAEWSLPMVMAFLAENRGGTARFAESRHLQMVATPLRSSGVLRYTAPDRLEKQTLQPRPARLALIGGRVTIEREGEASQTISLADYPEIGALVEGLRATLAGDFPALQRYYDVSLEGVAGAWTLTLRPRDARMQKLVREIRIAGSGGVLLRIDTIETDGDRTETIITPDAP